MRMRIYMDTARIRHAIGEMQKMLEEFKKMEGDFRAALQQLEQIWYGPSPEMYYQKQRAELQYMIRYHQLILELIETLRHELREYEMMDQF